MVTGGYGVVMGGYGWLRVAMGGNGVVIVDIGRLRVVFNKCQSISKILSKW